MKLIKVGTAVLNQTALDWERNKTNIIGAIKEARARKVSILCLPELCISGYGCEDAFHSPSVHRTAWAILHEIAPTTKGMIVAVGLPVFFQNAVFNAACLLVDGKVVGFTAKQNLAGEGIHYEPRFFKPWPSGVQGRIRRDGKEYPIGDLYYDCGGVKIGFEICEDAWVSSRPGSQLALKGVDVILNPSASHFAFGKHEIRKRFVAEGSRAFGVSYIYSNLLGNEAGRVIYDGGAIVASLGDIVASGSRFSFADREVTAAIIDVEMTRMNQARTSSFKPNLKDTAESCVRVDFKFRAQRLETGEAVDTVSSEWEASDHFKEEEFTRAVSLALYDYMRKSSSRGFIVSLSGGVDSAAVAMLIHLTATLGAGQLGVDGFYKKLDYLKKPKGINRKSAARDITRQLLTCAYQATRNSSATTRNAAQTLAESIGAEFHCFDVDPLVREYRSMIEKSIDRKLSWETDDIALQNIQARVRAPGVWLLANLKGALLVSTSNRSEAAVGYATMDGDTCGGLSPVAGIDKAFLREWLCWMEKTGPVGAEKYPFLSMVNVQAPTAELRPRKEKQTDEEDLMPYEILDEIERAAIRDKQDPSEIMELLRATYPNYGDDQLRFWIERFFRLWCRNQWKRERYAPSFHVDDENLDPKTWCRFPILSGGFERELAVLRDSKKK
ncbi:MAG: NAD+ synthase (glutamine-hydrolyzing) [Candidatus Binatia bacterium]